MEPCEKNDKVCFTTLVGKETDYGGKGKYAVFLRNHTIMTNGFFIELVNENIEEGSVS